MGILGSVAGPLSGHFGVDPLSGPGRGATMSDHDHIGIYTLGEDLSRRTQAPHIDVGLELWNKGHEPFSQAPK